MCFHVIAGAAAIAISVCLISLFVLFLIYAISHLMWVLYAALTLVGVSICYKLGKWILGTS
jgi:hypothetical protein